MDDVVIRSAQASDAVGLAQLCTDCFFGTHKFDDGPLIFLQRLQIYSRVFLQVSRRLAIDEGRECRLLVAADETSGAVRACVCDSRVT